MAEHQNTDYEASARGPWVKRGSAWQVTLTYPGSTDHVYEVEYRRTEPGCPAGFYLFGPGFDGLLLFARQAEMARYEAFARIVQRCPLPDGALDILSRQNPTTEHQPDSRRNAASEEN